MFATLIEQNWPHQEWLVNIWFLCTFHRAEDKYVALHFHWEIHHKPHILNVRTREQLSESTTTAIKISTETRKPALNPYDT